MKSRVITGIVGIALLAGVLLLPSGVLLAAIAVICGLAMVELLGATHFAKRPSLLTASVVFAALTPFFMSFSTRIPAFLFITAYVLALVAIQIRHHNDLPVEHTAFAFCMSLIFPLSISCLGYLRLFSKRDGVFYLVVGLIIPWMCDMGAYFVGTFFGKHKLCPGISPKKTVEGLVGGIVISVLGTVLAAWIYQAVFLKDGGTVVIWQFALAALVLAPLSVLGDLFASIIKRQCGVKDFGHIMPGHGGIMDRFDSVLLSVPPLYLLVHVLPMIR